MGHIWYHRRRNGGQEGFAPPGYCETIFYFIKFNIHEFVGFLLVTTNKDGFIWRHVWYHMVLYLEPFRCRQRIGVCHFTIKSYIISLSCEYFCNSSNSRFWWVKYVNIELSSCIPSYRVCCQGVGSGMRTLWICKRQGIRCKLDERRIF